MQNTLNPDGQYRRLNPGIQYNLKVVNLDGPKQIPVRGGHIYSTKLLFVDKFGYNYYAEYLTDSPTQSQFQLGKPSVFRVTRQDSKCDQISPVDVVQDVEKTAILSFINKLAPDNIFRLTMEYAVQIITAERTGNMQEFDPEKDSDRIVSIADKLAMGLQEKLALAAGDETFML